jgi:hypothetical protein
MKILRFLSLALALGLCTSARAQTVNASQQVVLEGLRSSGSQGSFVAAAFDGTGNLFLLLNEHDGIRVLKTDPTGSTVLAQAHFGTTGDAPIAMSLDPGGNLYITGTTTSGTLTGTSGTPFPAVADTSTNSFLAKYDTNLNELFLTFLGAGKTAAASVAATSDAAFVTGITFSPAFPVTAAGIQQAPASGSSENGFVERFSATGSTLVYATYLTGANGSTAPTAIVADASDNATITGSTSATGLPTISALQPVILGSNSGFLTKLNPTGSAFVFSTFIAGNGITGMALDPTSSTLLLTGNVALGQFPVATVAMPLTSASYQTLLRIPSDGQSVTSSILLVPGTQSYVSVGPNQTAWVSGALSTPLFPGDAMPDYNLGDSFLLHLTATSTIDQTLRFGGVATNNASYASLTSLVAAPAVSATGSTVFLPGAISATVSSSLLATQRFDLPLVSAPNTALPNTLRDIVPTASACGNSSQCTGSGALLASVSTSTQTTTILSISTDNLPNLTLRNLGSNTATGLSLSVSGFTLATNCGATLAPSNQCSIALTGAGPGTLTVSAANAPTSTTTLAANTLAPDALVLSTYELDYGITDAADGLATQTITVTNLSATTQTFSSAKDSGTTGAATFAEASTDCASGGATGVHTLPANSSCHIALGLTVSSSSANDGAIRATWKIGTRDVVLTAYAQAAALNISATEVDFGTQISGTTPNLPRYLYLSNNSNTAIAHASAALPTGSPFTVVDGCPSTLEPNTVCQFELTYLSAVAPSSDTATLTLDQGISVLITGKTLPPATGTGSAANPSLSVSTTSIVFSTAVAVTTVSSTTQSITLTNNGASGFSLAFATSGDFTTINGCPATLPGGSSCSVQIGFAPSQPGLRNGLLSITAGSGFTPTYVALSGTGSAILPANNGTLALGQTLVGEPLVAWYKIQQSLTTLTATTPGPEFAVALVQDNGTGHGTLPSSSFAQTATSACSNCWLGIQFLSQTAGTLSEALTLTSTSGGNPYLLAVTATALPVQGLLLTPIAQDFGPVAIHSTSGPILFTLANLLTSSVAATIQSVAATGDFTVVTNNSGGASCTGQLASTAACFVEVVFSPTATGARTGVLTIVTSFGTVTSTLTGYGSADAGIGINPTSLTFANVPGTAATQQSIALTNTGTSPLTIGTPTSSDPSFSVTSTCTKLAAGANCSLVVTFTPQTATVAATLSIPVTSTLNGQVTVTTYSVPLSGSYTSTDAGLEILPNAVNFGSGTTGALGQTRQFTLNNLSGKTVNVTLAMPREFPLASNASCPTLAPGASCTFSVSFLPITGGALTGTIYAQGTPTDHSATVQALAYMLGYGAASGSLSISGGSIPYSPINFGQVSSGQVATQTLTLTNSGTASLTIHRITSQPPFYTATTCGAILTSKQTCTVTLTYTPVYEIAAGTTGGARNDTGSLIVESDAITSPDVVALSGSALPVTSSNPASSSVIASYLLSESALTFSNTQIGNASATQTVTLSNTGTTTIHILSASTSVDFTSTNTCTTLFPGATCSFTLQFTPTNASSSGVRSGTLNILSDAATSLEFISLIGTTTPSPLTITPTALNFGTVNVGANDTLSATVTNNAATPVMFIGVATTGDYSTSRGTCPANGATLAAGSSCTLNVTFAPSAIGTRTGTLSLTNDATQLPLTVSLTGNAIQAQLQITPGALAFGNIDVSYPATLTLTLLNTGSASITGITNAINGLNAADFAVTAPCSTTTLAPNQGCTETVTFTPSTTGQRLASLSVVSSDPNSPAVIPLSGTGIQAGSFLLTVNGGSSATATVSKGQPAVYDLLATPSGGFAGNIALTCAPIIAAQYASCSLLSATLSLSGGTQYSTATLNTLTGKHFTGSGVLAALLLLPIAWFRRRKLRPSHLACGLLVLVLGGSVGCGGSSNSDSGILYTPAGTYQYQVTASSTSGTPISSTVTLNLIVQ